MKPRPEGGVFVAERKKVIRSIKGGLAKKNGFFVKPSFLWCVKEAETRMKNW
jgi:hypothetical protein